MAPYHDLAPAGLDEEQIADTTSTALHPSWLLSAESLMGRESALITKLAKLRLGDAPFAAHLAAVTAPQPNASNETEASAQENPQSEFRIPQLKVPTFMDGPPASPEAYHKLIALRQLERTYMPPFAS